MIVSIILLLVCLMLTLHNGKKRDYYASVKKRNYYASVKKLNDKIRSYYVRRKDTKDTVRRYIVLILELMADICQHDS